MDRRWKRYVPGLFIALLNTNSRRAVNFLFLVCFYAFLARMFSNSHTSTQEEWMLHRRNTSRLHRVALFWRNFSEPYKRKDKGRPERLIKKIIFHSQNERLKLERLIRYYILGRTWKPAAMRQFKYSTNFCSDLQIKGRPIRTSPPRTSSHLLIRNIYLNLQHWRPVENKIFRKIRTFSEDLLIYLLTWSQYSKGGPNLNLRI